MALTAVDTGRPAAAVADRNEHSARDAAWAFGAWIAVSVPMILYLGRDQWFFLDDWDFLGARDGRNLHDLLRPHNEHWSTLPILLYRALWRLAGIRHYWPYQLCLVMVHLAAAVLLRVVMRRAGVDPWIATAAAGLFAVLGAGRQDIVYAFAINLTGSLTFGLAYLVAVDRDGSFDRRDAAGMAAGLASLMCSTVGVTMVVAVAVAIAIRRGWRVATIHAGSLAAVYMAWWVAFGRGAFNNPKAGWTDIAHFVGRVAVYVFAGLGQVPPVGFLLAVVLVTGAVLSIREAGSRRQLAAPVGLASGAVFFVLTTGYGRAAVGVGWDPTSVSRYVHLVAAMTLPAIAVAASAIAGRWRTVLPVMVVLFVIGIPGNVRALRATGPARLTLGNPDLILTMAHLPLASEVRRADQPMPFLAPGITVGWLLDGASSGRIPKPRAAGTNVRLTAELLLSLEQTRTVSATSCTAIRARQPITVHRGDQIEFRWPGVDVSRSVNGRKVGRARYTPAFGRRLTVMAGPLELIVQPRSHWPAHLCR